MVATTPVLVLWIAGVVAATLAVLAWRARPNPGATPFAMTMFAATWWALASAAGLAASSATARLVWANFEWIGVMLLPVAWLWFCAEYTGRDRMITARTAALVLVIPVLTVVLVWTDGIAHDLFRQSSETVRFAGWALLDVAPGPWYWVATGYAYLLTLAGMFLLAELWFQNRAAYRRQVGLLIVAALFPAVIGVGHMASIVPVAGFDPTPLAFVVSGTILVGAVHRAGLFDTVPISNRVARTEVVERMDDGVLVVDSEDRIVDCNARGAAVVGCSTSEAVGRCAAEHVPGYEDALACEREAVTVSYDRGGTDRYIDVRITPFDEKPPRGAVVVLRDVTEDRRREQRLDVLNRVLRHNLRNDLNVVYGYAEHLDRCEQYDETAVEKIMDRSESLMSIGDKARKIEQFLGRAEPDPVTVGPLLDHEARRLQDQYEDVEVVVESLPEDTRCAGTIGPVVRDLLENAAEHNDSETPVVRLDARRHGGELVVRVTDNGPGLPEQEQAVLENGRETPLEHGSGLGLWLVVWGVREMNGTVSFETPSDRGCVVVVRVPAEEIDDPETTATGLTGGSWDGASTDTDNPQDDPSTGTVESFAGID